MNKYAITKLQAIALATIVIIAIIAASVYYYSTPKEKTILNVITVGGTRFEIPQKNILDGFYKEYPNVEVRFTTADWGSTVDRVMLELASGSGAFDVVFIDWIVIQELIEAGYLLALNEYIYNPDPKIGVPDYETDFPENVRSLYVGKDGNTYAFPIDANTQMTYARIDAFKEAGLKIPEDIDTWEEIIQAAKKLRDYNSNYRLALTMKPPWWTVTVFTVLVLSFGEVIYDENFVPHVNSTTAQDALKFLIELYKYCPADVLSWEDAEIAEAMRAGGVVLAPCTWGGAAVVDPTWNPDYAEKFTLVKVPKGPGGKTWQVVEAGYANEMGGAGYAIPKTCPKEKRDLAWAFIRYVQDLPPYPSEKTRKYLEGGGQPARLSVLGDARWWADFPLLKGLYENLPTAQYRWMQIPEFSSIATMMAPIIQDALIGKKTVKEACDEMWMGMYNIFKESGRYK